MKVRTIDQHLNDIVISKNIWKQSTGDEDYDVVRPGDPVNGGTTTEFAVMSSIDQLILEEHVRLIL